MYDSKITLIIDLIFAGLFAVLSFAEGAIHLGEPYNELYFTTAFICTVLAKFIAEKIENFKKDK